MRNRRSIDIRALNEFIHPALAPPPTAQRTHPPDEEQARDDGGDKSQQQHVLMPAGSICQGAP